jgi:methyl acetate hydrolase
VKTEEGKKMIVEMVSKPGYFPNLSTENVEHSVGFLINLEGFEGRRGAKSGCWSGAAKTQFWIDPSNGIAVSWFNLYNSWSQSHEASQSEVASGMK